MRLYAGMSRNFVEDAVHNRIASKLRDAFLAHFRHQPSPGEEQSWRNSLRAVSQVFEHGRFDDHGVILEYQLPLTSRRLDCLVTGRNGQGRDEAVILELKQWSECEATDEPTIIRSVVGGAMRDLLHPSAQVRQYRDYLSDMHTAFYEGITPVTLSGCAYLHNYETEASDPLLAPQYEEVIRSCPIFCTEDVDALVGYLRQRLEGGDGYPVLQRIEQSKFRPSKKLLQHVAKVIRDEPAYVLLDEQKIVFDRIFRTIVSGHAQHQKHVFLVNGGPGTGKSVIAIQLMAEISRRELNAQYATGSQAFTKTLQKILGSRAAVQFKYFSNYGHAAPSEIDVLICDEAHRLRATSTNRFTPSSRQTGKAQIQEIMDAAKVSVFFIDDRQVVRPGEVGSMELVRQTARANNSVLHEYTLEAQFRCSGSEGFVNWIDNTLGIRNTANVLFNQASEAFELKFFDSPIGLENEIRLRADEGHSARMTAGYCWPWSKELEQDGKLKLDVTIGDYKRPWNARSGVSGLARGIPKEVHWAHEPGGLNQIGCVYTAQGFEFDYVGVIWGNDLVYDPDEGEWKGNRTESQDWVVSRSGDRFIDLVRNTYRVLLTRGIKGCYVHFLDKNTEAFVRSRTEGLGRAARSAAPAVLPLKKTAASVPPFLQLVPPDRVQPFVSAIPLMELKIAAGFFSNEAPSASEGTTWVALPETYRMQQGLFVAQVSGESMNRLIPNGAWCLFKANPVGSREGKVVVAEHRQITDPDGGAHLTVKRYHSEKVANDEEVGWRHVRIGLHPYSTDPAYKPIELAPDEANSLRVIAEFVAVLG